MIPVWLEVHVDGADLERTLPWRARRRWDADAAALDDLARRAERHGARLSFRVREGPARRDRHLFAELVRRGHEVGWHAHGARLREARDAVVAAGGTARIATPGMVQARDWRKMAVDALHLGARLLTDRVERPLVQYQGLLAWEPVPGLLQMDVTLSPFAWGVLRRDGRRVVPGRLDVARLLALIAHRDRFGAPAGAPAFFGATFHEHDVRDAEVRRELEQAFAALGERIVPSERVLLGAGGQAPRNAPRTDARPGGSGPAGAGSRAFGAALRRIHRARLRLERAGAPASLTKMWVQGVAFDVRRVGPAHPDAALVLVHGGGSGVRQGLAPFGISEAALAEMNLAAWTFARSEGQAPPGNARTVQECATVLRAALAEGRPVALLTWSAGVIPALRAALQVQDPRIVALIDVEGPADRFSLVPPGEDDHPLATRDPWDDAAWEGLEAVALIGRFPGRYLRVQGEDDHVHGPHTAHARRMVDAARDGCLNTGDGALLPGRVAAHGPTILEWVRAYAVGG